MLNLKKYIIGTATLATVVLGASGLASCSWINDDIQPCVVENRVKFTFTRNMLQVDAFPTQVESVEMYVFNTEGTLVYKASEAGSVLADPDYYMPLPVGEGQYEIVVWGGLKDEVHFAKDLSSPEAKEDMTVTLKTKQDVEKLYHDENLTPLFHGYKTIEVEQSPDGGIHTYVVDLTKDTNQVNVLLHHLDGSPLDMSDFTIHIESTNSKLAYDNKVISPETVHYMPWNLDCGNLTRADQDINYLLAEMTTSRLVPDQGSRLVVTRNDDKKDIISINLEKYILLIKGSSSMSDEEFLDREDHYAFQFILDESNNWYIAGGVFINNWRIVPPQDY